IGLRRGRVLNRIEGADDLPDVVWTIDFDDMASQTRDMDARAASPEFEVIRQGMRQLYRRFERPLFEAEAIGTPVVAAPQPGQAVVLVKVFCDAAECPMVRDRLLEHVASTDASALELSFHHPLRRVSHENDVPRFIWEFAQDNGLPQPSRTMLARIAPRVEFSLWRTVDAG
ncbi:MAG: hypothetical protein KIT18_14910, partial [Burkholderiales bacterium]|nr:hypothetical protein [Burkholderiales bacterium]